MLKRQRTHLSTLLPMLLLAAACGQPDRPALSAARMPIINGTVDMAHPAIVAFIWRSRGLALCSGILLTRRAVLTAAHCPVQWQAQGLSLADFGVFVGESYASGAPLLTISEARVSPEFNPKDPEVKNDVAVVLLAEDAPAEPFPWSYRAVDGLTGKLVSAAGYGVTRASPPGGDGTRLIVEQTVESVDPSFLYLTGDNSGVCLGDSGGPVFFRDESGAESVVGVNSFTWDPSCLAGSGAARTDKHACFIAEAAGVVLPVEVSIVSPADGASISGAFQVEVAASFHADLSAVELWVDGTQIPSPSAPPWIFSVDALAPGRHVLLARAMSGGCAFGERAVYVSVPAPPPPPSPDAGPAADPGEPAPADDPEGCGCGSASGAAGAGVACAACLLGLALRGARGAKK